MATDMYKVTASLIVSLVLASVACAAPSGDASSTSDSAITSADTAPMSNFVEVRPGLYRGGHPDEAGLDYLKSHGVHRVLDLEVGDFIEATPWSISDELDAADARGITEIRYPMSAFEAGLSDRFDANMDAMIALLATATPDDPIYVHCKHGQDRTGLVVGLERVFDESWAPGDAYAEMVKLGFHPGFLGLNDYFERKTGWED